MEQSRWYLAGLLLGALIEARALPAAEPKPELGAGAGL